MYSTPFSAMGAALERNDVAFLTLNKSPDVRAPHGQRLALFGGIGRLVIDACHACLVAADMIANGFHYVRRAQAQLA